MAEKIIKRNWVIRKVVRAIPLQYDMKKTTKLCVEWSWVNKKLVLLRDGVKDCILFSERPTWGGGGFTCGDVANCPVVVQLQLDVNNIETDINTINTTITNIQNATSVEAIQDIVAPLLVHGNHVGLTATYNDLANQIILTVTGWGGWGFTCADVATCITSNTTTRNALLNWLQNLANVTLVGNWNFNWDVSFNSNTVTFNNATVNHTNITELNYDNTTVSNHNGDTTNYNLATVNSTNTTYNHTNDNINYDTSTDITWGTFNNITINWATINWPLTGAGILGADEKLQATWTVINQVISLPTIPRSWIKSLQITAIGWVLQISPTDYSYNATTNAVTMLVAPWTSTPIEIQYPIKDAIVSGTAHKIWPVTWAPSGSSFVITNLSSTATSVINGDNITTGIPNGNYFVYNTSTPWQITVTSKDFLWNNVVESWIQFYYTITY